jgi:hypothetical protein
VRGAWMVKKVQDNRKWWLVATSEVQRTYRIEAHIKL